jgi:hypothetical protein
VIHRLRAVVSKGDLVHVPLDINDVVAEAASLFRSAVVIRRSRPSSVSSRRRSRCHRARVIDNMRAGSVAELVRLADDVGVILATS